MYSRYSVMTESLVEDVDNLAYPDPLSINYVDTQFYQVPKRRELSSADLKKFWLYFLKKYGTAEGDDILLTLNNVPYLGMLEPGDYIYLIDKGDIFNFHNQKQPK